MRIPKSFTVFGNTVNIIEVDKLENNNYADWNDAKEEIRIAHRIKMDGEVISLSQTQMEQSFWHEVIHAWQWYSGKEYDEIEAQTYANMLVELIKSSGIKINPNIIQEPANEIDPHF